MECYETPSFEEIDLSFDFTSDHTSYESSIEFQNTCLVSQNILSREGLRVISFSNADFGLYCCTAVVFNLLNLLDSGVPFLKSINWLRLFYDSITEAYISKTIELCEREYKFGNIPYELFEIIERELYDLDVLLLQTLVDLVNDMPVFTANVLLMDSLRNTYCHLCVLNGSIGSYKASRLETSQLKYQIIELFPNIDNND